MPKLGIAGLATALISLAVTIGAWLAPPDTISYSVKFALILFGIIIGLGGTVLLGRAFLPSGSTTKNSEEQISKPPRLKIVFRSDMPWVQHNPKMQDPGHHIAHSGSLFTYRLAVINHVCDLAEQVAVEIIWIDPEIVAHRLVPCRLHFRHDNPPQTQPFAQAIDVARTNDARYQDAQFVDVFWYWTAPEKERLGIWSSVRGIDQEIPVNSYKFAIKVSSRNCGPPITKEFRFIYRAEKLPTIEPDDSL